MTHFEQTVSCHLTRHVVTTHYKDVMETFAAASLRERLPVPVTDI